MWLDGEPANFVLDARTSRCLAGESMADTTTSHRLAASGSVGDLLTLIRTGRAETRSDLARITGLGRSTVAHRLDRLLASGLVEEVGEARSTGGRPAVILGFNADAGVVLVADLGATHSRLAVTNLSGSVIADVTTDLDIGTGPRSVLSWVMAGFDDLLTSAGRSAGDVRGVGIGVPGPVEFAAGRAVHPPIMPGWDGYDIRQNFAERFEVPVLVDNDVNIMAFGEYWAMRPRVNDFLFIKVGTGIGSGLILGGRLHRGDRGAAGDIGHVQAGDADVICRCGNTGCLEASAGGAALAKALAEQGHPAENSRDVVELVRSGNHDAIQAVRDAGRLIGRVLATTVNMLNPARIMIGGDVARAGEQLLAGIREVVYQRSTALATNRLDILTSALGDLAGVTGAAAMVIEHVLAPDSVEEALRTQGVAAG